MKKVFSIVSVLSVLSLFACRSGNEEYDPPEPEHIEVVPRHYFQRDSTEYSHSAGENDQEPPRKDLLQWRGKPENNAGLGNGNMP
jgi:hypothetical protein